MRGGEPVSEERAPLDREAALAYAGRALAMRALSEAELRERLRRRGCPEEIAEEVVVLMRGYGYLDDADLAERVGSRPGLGRRRAEAELRRRGIPDELADAALAERSDEAELEQARALLHKHLPRARRSKHPRANAYAHLARRGFESRAVMAALAEVNWGAEGEDEEPFD